MSAAAAPVAERAPFQPGLLGIPEAPPVADLRYSMVGQLQRPAEVRITADGLHAHLFARLVQRQRGGRNWPPLVCVHQAHHTDVIALEALALRLHAGSYALAICRGIEFDFDRHELRVWRCDHIVPLTPAEAARFQPDESPDAPATAATPPAPQLRGLSA